MGGIAVVMDKKNLFDHWLRIIAIAVIIVGLALTIEGFLIDPQGQIHPSVLIYFGECLIFVGCVPIVGIYTREKEKKKKGE